MQRQGDDRDREIGREGDGERLRRRAVGPTDNEALGVRLFE
jgi:hypothetical protein